MGDLVETGSKYSDEDRRRAVAEYCVHGTISQVSKATGIPGRTLSGWKNTDWWVCEYTKVRAQKEEEITANNLAIITAAQEGIKDRIANGDHHLNKDGKLVRVPVKARDLSVVSGIAWDKSVGAPLIQPMSGGSAAEAVAHLVQMFEEIADQHNARTIEGEYTSKGSEVADESEDAL